MPASHRRLAWLPPLLGAALSIATYVHVIRVVSGRITNYDATVVWAEAYDWRHLAFHQPNYYGQSYGSNLIGIPVALLHSLGMSFGLATPIALAASMLGLWFALGIAAFARGKPVLATAACAAPAVLSSYNAMYVSSVTFERVFILTGVAGALLIWGKRTPLLIAVVTALAGLGFFLDGSSVMLIVPVLAWWLLDGPLGARIWRGIALGAVVPAAFFVFTLVFYKLHPDYDTHRLPLAPSFGVLTRSLGHLDLSFQLSAAELVRAWWIPVVVACVCVAGLLWSRRRKFVVPAALFFGLVVLALAHPRSGSTAAKSSGTFLPPGRLLLFFAPAIWFLFVLLSEAYPRLAARCARAALVGILALAVVSLGARGLISSHDPETMYTSAVYNYGYAFTATVKTEARCARLERQARTARADVIVLLVEPAELPDACAADGARALALPFDRRTWRLSDEAARTSTRALYSPVPRTFCTVANRRFTRCTRTGSTAVLQYRPQSQLNVLALLGLTTRAYGNDCVVTLQGCSSGHDAGSKFPIATGPNLRPASTDLEQIRAALNAFSRGDAQAVEPGAGTKTLTQLTHVLRRSPVHLGRAYPTGTHTWAAHTTVPQAHGGPTPLVLQFIELDGRVQVAWSSECELAALNRIPCTSGVGNTWFGFVR
jgi:hypothetical protein